MSDVGPDGVDERLDRQLRDAGERWRAGRTQPRAFSVEDAVHRDQPSSQGKGVLSLAGVVAGLMVLILVIVSLPGPSDVSTASPTPSAEPVATASGSPSPNTPSPTPLTASPTPAVADVIQLAEGSVRTIEPGFAIFYSAQAGPIVGVVSDRNGVYVADLTTGEVAKIDQAGRNHEILGVDVSSSYIVWLDATYERFNPDAAPCGRSGVLTWELRAFNLASGAITVVVSGEDRRLQLCTAWPPQFAIAGDLIAYVEENPTESTPAASRVSVVSLASGDTIRTFDTERGVYDLAFDGTDVVFIDGTYDEELEPFGIIDTQLLWSPADGSPLVHIADDVQNLSLGADRLSWTSTVDQYSTMTTTLGDLDPMQIAPGNRGSSAWGDLVAWSTDAPELMIWDARTGDSRRVVPPVRGASMDDSWLVWISSDFSGANDLINGIPLSEVPL